MRRRVSTAAVFVPMGRAFVDMLAGRYPIRPIICVGASVIAGWAGMVVLNGAILLLPFGIGLVEVVKACKQIS